MAIEWLSAFEWLFASAIVGAVAVWLYRKANMKAKWAIGIDINKVSQPKICEGTGIAVLASLIAVMLAYFAFFGLNYSLAVWLAVCTLFALIGFLDDLRHKFSGKSFPWAVRTVPVLIVAFAFALFYAPSAIWIVPVALLVAGMAGLQNTFAGLNGWQGGSGLIISIAVAFLLQGTWLFVPALILVGAIIGFMCWNVYPSRVFEGDSGTLLIGSAVAGLLVLSGRIEFMALGILFFIPHMIDVFFLKFLTNPKDMTQSKFRPYKVLSDGRLGIPDYPGGKNRYDFAKLVMKIFGPLREWQISAIIWAVVGLNALLWLFVFGKI